MNTLNLDKIGNWFCFLLIALFCAGTMWAGILMVLNFMGTPCTNDQCHFRMSIGVLLILGSTAIIFAYVAFEKFVQEKEKTILG